MGGEGPSPPFRKLCAPVCPRTILGIDFYSGFRINAQGGGGQFEILKNPSIDFYSGFRKKKLKVAIRNPKKNPGIDFNSGFRKASQGGCNSNS